MRAIATIVLYLLLCSASAAFAITVTTEAGAAPESIAATPDGGLILASNKPFIYRAEKGETQARKFIDVSADGNASFLGMLVDSSSNMLWACEGIANANGNGRHSVLHSFDLTTGIPKISWALPGDTSTCNDIAIGPDHAVYASDTANSRIYRLRPGWTSGEMLIQNRVLDGVDGITFMGGQLYANNVSANTIWRIPMDASGKAGDPVPIWTDQPIKGPDGMRAEGDHIYLAENRNGRDSMLTIEGDIAHVTVIQTGMTQPTAIDPAGDILWIGDRAKDGAVSIPLPH